MYWCHSSVFLGYAQLQFEVVKEKYPATKIVFNGNSIVITQHNNPDIERETIESGEIKMEIILIRHADPDYKNDTITERGHAEARALALSLKEKRLDALYASPLGRAQETKRYIAEALNMESTTLEWSREVSGSSIDGYAAWEHPGTDYLARENLASPQNWWEGFAPGEALKPHFATISEGFDNLLESHGYPKWRNMYKIKTRSDKTIALVCHKGTILTLLAHILHWPLPLIYIHGNIDTTGVTRLYLREVDSEYAVFKLRVMNDRSHLKSI